MILLVGRWGIIDKRAINLTSSNIGVPLATFTWHSLEKTRHIVLQAQEFRLHIFWPIKPKWCYGIAEDFSWNEQTASQFHLFTFSRFPSLWKPKWLSGKKKDSTPQTYRQPISLFSFSRFPSLWKPKWISGKKKEDSTPQKIHTVSFTVLQKQTHFKH